MESVIKDAFKSQYRAGLRMLRECIERCPDELWGEVTDQFPRTYWRIAYHTIFYTHLYLCVDSDSFDPWDKHVWHGQILWNDDESGVPPDETPFTQTDLVAYVDWIDQSLDERLSAIDFSAAESGFSWYPISKFEHQLVNLRHLGVHVGQLQSLLYAKNVELSWFGRG
jgi:hypothetical protein